MELLRERPSARAKKVRPYIACAQCGEHLYMPDWSERLDGARVRHLWTCSTCDYAFETTVQYAIEVDTAA